MPLLESDIKVAADLESADRDLQQGPLVGQREPSTAITTEYASADPVFQAKTAVSYHPSG